MVPTPGEPRGFETGAARRAESFGHTLNDYLINPVRDGFTGLARGLSRSLVGPLDASERDQLRGSAEFIGTAPRSLAARITILVERSPGVTDKGIMLRLTNHAEWLTALGAKPLTAAADGGALTPLKCLPADVLATIPPPERQQLFADYFKEFIPTEVRRRDAFKNVFGDGADDPSKFLDPANVTIILNAMKDMVGMTAGPPPAPPVAPAPPTPEYLSWSIAKSALQRRYFQENTDGSPVTRVVDGVPRGVPTGNMVNDYRGLRRGYPGRDTRTTQSIRGLNSKSMLGAAASERFGIFDNDDLAALNAQGGPIEAAERREATRLPSTVAALDRLTRTTETHVEREAMTIYDKWRELPPMVKITMLAALGYLAMKRPKAAAALVVAGVGTYMLTDKDMLNGLFKRGQALAGPRAPDRAVLERRAQVMFRFLNERARTRLESEITGFVLLADTPMSILTAATTIGPDGMTGRLNMTNVQKQAVRNTLKAKGYDDRAIDRYLGECSANPRASGDAIVATFYVMASMSPAYAADAQMIEEKIGQMEPGNQSIQYILANIPVGDPRRTTADGRDIVALYKHLIVMGRDMASTSGETTLGDVVNGALSGGTYDSAPGVSAEEAERTRVFDERVNALEESFNGQPRKLSAKRNGANVTIGVKQERILGGIRETRFDGPTHEIPQADFLGKSPAELRNVWLDAAITKKTEELRDPDATKRVQVARDGDNVKYSRDIANAAEPAAKSPALVFMATDNAVIKDKFSRWHMAKIAPPVPGRPPVAVDDDALRM